MAMMSIVVSACGTSTDQKDKLSRKDQIKLKQYIIEGKQLYTLHCSNCHQKDGTGLGKLIPPLANADYMAEDLNRTVCLIKNGIAGEIVVNGQQYNQPMPANPKLTPLEVAEITTYIYNTWGNEKRIILVNDVAEILNGCGNAD